MAPPFNVSVLIVWTKPPKSSVPPVTVVAEAALKAFGLVATSDPPDTIVAPE